MQGNPGKGKQPMPGGKGMGCMGGNGCRELTGLHGALLLLALMVVMQEPEGLDARSNCKPGMQQQGAPAGQQQHTQ